MSVNLTFNLQAGSPHTSEGAHSPSTGNHGQQNQAVSSVNMFGNSSAFEPMMHQPRIGAAGSGANVFAISPDEDLATVLMKEVILIKMIHFHISYSLFTEYFYRKIALYVFIFSKSS